MVDVRDELPMGDTQAQSRDAVEQLFVTQYGPLVRLAILLVRDQGAAEELVQDAFVRGDRSWDRILVRTYRLPRICVRSC